MATTACQCAWSVAERATPRPAPTLTVSPPFFARSTTGNEGATANVLGRNISCACGTKGGVIYNQGGTVRNVTFSGFLVRGTNQGAGIKISRPGKDATGGLVEGVAWEDYRIEGPRNAALYINVFSEDAQPPCELPKNPALPNWLTVRGALFKNVSASVPAGQAAGCFRCTPGAPCGMVADGLRVVEAGSGAAARPFVCRNAHMAGAAEPSACA